MCIPVNAREKMGKCGSKKGLEGKTFGWWCNIHRSIHWVLPEAKPFKKGAKENDSFRPGKVVACNLKIHLCSFWSRILFQSPPWSGICIQSRAAKETLYVKVMVKGHMSSNGEIVDVHAIFVFRHTSPKFLFGFTHIVGTTFTLYEMYLLSGSFEVWRFKHVPVGETKNLFFSHEWTKGALPTWKGAKRGTVFVPLLGIFKFTLNE